MHRRRKMLAVATKLADHFSLLPGVEKVVLTGSLAREQKQENVGDIDLVLLHDSSLKDAVFVLERKVTDTGKYHLIYPVEMCEGTKKMLELFGDRAWPILRFMNRTEGLKVDIFCLHSIILTDCNYLSLIHSSQNRNDHEFYKTLFCENPMYAYNMRTGKFSEDISHNNRS